MFVLYYLNFFVKYYKVEVYVEDEEENNMKCLFIKYLRTWHTNYVVLNKT